MLWVTSFCILILFYYVSKNDQFSGLFRIAYKLEISMTRPIHFLYNLLRTILAIIIIRPQTRPVIQTTKKTLERLVLFLGAIP